MRVLVVADDPVRGDAVCRRIIALGHSCEVKVGHIVPSKLDSYDLLVIVIRAAGGDPLAIALRAPSFAVTVDVLSNLLDAATARTSGDSDPLAVARGTLSGGNGDVGADARLATDLLHCALVATDGAAERSAVAASRSSASLVVGQDGRWFSVDDGPRVDLARRAVLRRILAALTRQHELDPDSGISTAALLAAGWPGERMTRSSGAARVWKSIARLRGLGLRDLLVRAGDGYSLASAARVSRADH